MKTSLESGPRADAAARLLTGLVATCLAGGLALGAAPLSAQAPGIELQLNPRIGLYQPLSDLGQIGDAATNTANELSGSLAIGLGAELAIALLPVDIRFNLDYATGSEVRVEDGDVGTAAGTETTLLALVGDVMLRPIPRIIIAQPYFFAGGGLKQYDFEPTDPDAVATFEDESDWTVHLGGGLDVGLGPIALNAEIGDYISWWEVQSAATTDETEMQHDLFVTVGFSIGLL